MNKYINLVCFLVLSFLFRSPLFADSFLTHELISTDHDKIQGRITHIIQDRKGLLWMSSYNGLHRYDGYDIVKYKSFPLVSNHIHMICENSDGDIWCISSQRLYLFKTREERFIDVHKVFETNAPSNIVIDRIFPLSNGVTWMVSIKGECFRFKNSDPLNSCERLNYLLGSNEDVYNVFLDKDGKEWIMSAKGLLVYGESNVVSNLPYYYHYSILEGEYFATLGGSICYYERKSKILSDVSISDKVGRIHHCQLGKDSLLYLATDSGLFSLELNSKRESVLLNECLLKNFYKDSRGNVWGITPEYRIVLLSSDGSLSFTSLPSDIQITDYRVYFKEDEQGVIWLFFHDNSDICYYNTRLAQFVRPRNPNPIYKKIYGFLDDNSGNVYFRTDDGMLKTSLHSNLFEVENPAQEHEVRCMMTDNKGRIWICGRNKTIQIFDSEFNRLGYLNSQGNITEKPKLTSILAYSIMQDSQGRIWIGSRMKGVYLLTPKSDSLSFDISHYGFKVGDIDGLQHAAVFSIFEDSRQNIWVGTHNGGLHLWNDGKFIHYGNGLSKDSGAKPMGVRQIFEPRPGIIAVCSKEGFFTFSNDFARPEEVHFYANEKSEKPGSLSENDVVSAYQCADGTIYLATMSGGLNVIESSDILSNNIIFKSFTHDNGLSSDALFSVIEENDHKLWLVGYDALMRFDRHTHEIETYDISHFGVKLRFSEALPIKFHNRLYVGTTIGLIHFDPSLIKKNEFDPSLVITGLNVQQIPSYERISLDNHLQLDSDERNIEIKFAKLDFYNGPSRIRYAYKLDGVDKTWNYTSKNSVTYLNLPKGSYPFRLRATNGTGVWSDNDLVLNISVAPRFFESVWGYLFMLLVLVLIMLVIFYYYRRFYWLRHRLSIEKEMSEVKLDFFTDISHELRTPLTLIGGPVAEMKKDTSMTAKSRYYLDLVDKNTQRMLNLINQILDIRKLQNNQMKMVIQSVDVMVTLRSIMEQFNALAEQHNIDFVLKENNNLLNTLWVDRDKFEKIFYNLLSNAFKYTPDGKRICVSVHSENSGLFISVIDEGCGISEEHQKQLFRRFETIMKNNLFKPSSGIGLSLIKQYVEMHRATITVQSKKGEGSCFCVKFLWGKEHFDKDKVEIIENIEPIVTSESVSESSDAIQDLSTQDTRPQVLVVEDNDDVRGFIMNILSEQYRVCEAENGEIGFVKAQQLWPDLIISDVMMPVMDGFEMLQKVRKDNDLYSVPVILLTAKSALENKIEGTTLGADDYITKPFSASYMLAKVGALIEQRRLLKARLLQQLIPSENKTIKALEPSSVNITSMDEEFINRLMECVDKHMSEENFTLAIFIQDMNMGRTVFCNKVKSILGVSPMDFVLDMRMKRASQLLSSHQFTVSEVAYKVGFSNPKYFSKIFKKHYGFAPSEFVKHKESELI